MTGEGTPQRRHDDTVSFREMVEYVARADAEFHAIRAESLIQVSNSLEKLEKQLEDHRTWHRDTLETLLRSRRTNGIAVASVGVAALSLVLSLVVVLTKVR